MLRQPAPFKQHFFVPQLILLRTKRSADGAGFDVLPEPRRHPKLALIGARARVSLHAIAMPGTTSWAARTNTPARSRRLHAPGRLRRGVNCSHPAGTCFCTSTGTGPRVDAYFDVALSPN
ncbi:MAG: hypothetical protein R3B07_06185 [Polyangiaceae bacterium]